MEATVCQPCLMFRVEPAPTPGVAGVFLPGLFAVVKLHSTVFGFSKQRDALRIRDPANDKDSLVPVQCPVDFGY